MLTEEGKHNGKEKAYIFDLDGTIANTLTSIAYFGNRALETYGYQPIEEQKYRYMVGNGAKILVRRMLRENGIDRRRCLTGAFFTTRAMMITHFIWPYPYAGIPEMLKKLKSNDIKLAVLSNKPHSTTCKVAEKLFGNQLFDLVYGQREGVPLKPDPEPLLSVIKELGVKPTECVYAGDTATDIQTGKNAGVFTVGVLWGFRDEAELRENHADAVITTANQLLDFME